MLLEFSLSNFKSYDYLKKQEGITLIPDYRSNNDVLNEAVIFGGNASGKSNIIHALTFAKSKICDILSDDYTPEIFCKCHDGLNQPTEFSFVIQIDDQPYRYSISYKYINKKSIDGLFIELDHESLEIYNKKTDKFSILFDNKGEIEDKINALQKELSLKRKKHIELTEKLTLLEEQYRITESISSSIEKKRKLEEELKQLKKIQEKITNDESSGNQYQGWYPLLNNEVSKNTKDSGNGIFYQPKSYFDRKETPLLTVCTSWASDLQNKDPSESKEYINKKISECEYEIKIQERILKIVPTIKTKDSQILSQINSVQNDINIIISEINKIQSKIADQSKITTNHQLPMLKRIADGLKHDQKKDLDKIEKHCKKVYRWFMSTLQIVDPDDFVLPSMEKDDILKISDIISKFDIGISGVDWEEVEDSKIDEIMNRFNANDRLRLIKRSKDSEDNSGASDIISCRSGVYHFSYFSGIPTVHELKVIHNGSDKKHSLINESDGTRRIIELASILIKQKKDSVFVVDELDRRLHPILSMKFIKEFKKLYDGGNTQLIFTTHESRLLSTDFFRKDEIWLVDRNEDGASHISRLCDKNNTNTDRLDNLYLKNKIGGTPKIE